VFVWGIGDFVVAETIFTKILSGAIPCHKVFEDEHVFAFLDINPLSPGHTLVIPKEPAPTLDVLSEASAAAIGRVLPRLSRAVMAATGTKDFNILQNNGAGAHQAVFHVHFHIIPKPAAPPVSGRSETAAAPGQLGLGIGWEPGALPAEVGAALAAQIQAALQSP